VDRGGAQLNAFVLDASAALGWCFEDEGEDALDTLERAQGAALFVPAVWPLEIANALLVGMRRRRLNTAEASRYLELLGALEIEIEPPHSVSSLAALTALAQAHGLSAYDASYLELALRRGLPLATVDEALTRAARAAGVPKA
jgi:predicted nucleic acid-binding protein